MNAKRKKNFLFHGVVVPLDLLFLSWAATEVRIENHCCSINNNVIYTVFNSLTVHHHYFTYSEDQTSATLSSKLLTETPIYIVWNNIELRKR